MGSRVQGCNCAGVIGLCRVGADDGRLCSSSPKALVALWYPFQLVFWWFKVPLESNQPQKGCSCYDAVAGLPREL